MLKKKDGKGKRESFLLKPGKWIARHLPQSWIEAQRAKLCVLMRNLSIQSEEELRTKVQEFIVRQVSIIFWGSLLTIVLSVAVFVAYQHQQQVVLERNPFGDGESVTEVVLKKGRKQKYYTLKVSDRTLTEKEKIEYFKNFFHKLEDKICGKNSSLRQVNQPLNLVDSLDGYPFSLDYEINDDYLSSNGELSEKADQMHEGQRHGTEIIVTAQYEDVKETHTYHIGIIPQVRKHKRLTLMQKVEKKIREVERQSRTKPTVKLPESYHGVFIKEPKEGVTPGGVAMIMILGIVVLVSNNYSKLKENRKKNEDESIRDFAQIVHMFVLLSGAGLSMSSTVHRIVKDYQERKQRKGNRYAYDQLALMCYQMDTGMSQKEACLNWGKRFDAVNYQKLSLILVQNLSKGSRETKAMMEEVERDAFRQRMDRARKEGEEASTKMLLPMIVLLLLVMLIVMYPAVISFSGF
ncbi:MAG: type II secretion system F family protein [Lachnospiraceae bacterium]|nr:type II secretion system F family protein [Lachnospiraceae bacterium]